MGRVLANYSLSEAGRGVGKGRNFPARSAAVLSKVSGFDSAIYRAIASDEPTAPSGQFRVVLHSMPPGVSAVGSAMRSRRVGVHILHAARGLPR
jgi:hypothetical protein